MDRINANVFREMKNAKHGKKVNDIYAPKNRPPDKKNYLKPTGKYELFDDVPGYNNNQSNPKNKLPPGKSNQLISKNTNNQKNIINNELDSEQDLYYADPNNYTRDLKTNMVVSKNGVVTRTNGSGITTIQAMVNNPKNPNAPEAWQYKIRTKKMESPNLDIDANQLQTKKQNMSAQEKQLAKMTGRVLVNTVKNNRMTKGTQGMMDNERLHSQEAIESGIYVTWSTQSQGGKTVDCFRIGSNSMCICGHGFPFHDKILTKKKFSNKCNKCKCKGFKYIPIYPEEIGEYWIPFQKNFSYNTYKVKCKCKHTWNEHDGSGYLNCKKCGCGEFNSAFCCAVCNKFWQDHEMIYETEDERKMNGKPVREDYIPFNEMPEMYDALYK